VGNGGNSAGLTVGKAEERRIGKKKALVSVENRRHPSEGKKTGVDHADGEDTLISSWYREAQEGMEKGESR